MSTVQNVFDVVPVHPNATTKDFTCGCEFEIESISSHGGLDHDPEFSVVTDHSLRNNGYEYKTYPMSYDATLKAFNKLHSKIKISKATQQFSERTSIHIHVNCRQVEVSTLRQLILTYALLEPVFFAFVGDNRKHNIFCVPLNFTYLPEIYKKDVLALHKQWHKYTAFNIQPLSSNKDGPGLGTVEYRHLYGTKDPEIFKTWLTTLKQFHEFFVQYPDYDLLKVLETKTPSDIAYQCIPILATNYSPHQLNTMMENTLIDVKLSVGGLLK